jgi:hypothetical protein
MTTRRAVLLGAISYCLFAVMASIPYWPVHLL